jgi:hypothetical protein
MPGHQAHLNQTFLPAAAALQENARAAPAPPSAPPAAASNAGA